MGVDNNMDIDDPPFRNDGREGEDRNDGREGEDRDDSGEDEGRDDGAGDGGLEEEEGRGDGREDEDYDDGGEDEDLQGPMRGLSPPMPEPVRQDPNPFGFDAEGPILANDGNNSDFSELSVDDQEPPSRPTYRPDPPLPLTPVEKRALRMLWQMKKTGGTVENYEGFASVFEAEGLEGTNHF